MFSYIYGVGVYMARVFFFIEYVIFVSYVLETFVYAIYSNDHEITSWQSLIKLDNFKSTIPTDVRLNKVNT